MSNRNIRERTQYETIGMWPWLLQRITGLLLLILLGGHFFIAHYTVKGPMTFETSATLLRDPFWVWFDIILLVMVIFHGLNGIRTIVLDFGPRRIVRGAMFWLMVAVGIVTFIFGIWALLPFTKSF